MPHGNFEWHGEPVRAGHVLDGRRDDGKLHEGGTGLQHGELKRERDGEPVRSGLLLRVDCRKYDAGAVPERLLLPPGRDCSDVMRARQLEHRRPSLVHLVRGGLLHSVGKHVGDGKYL